MSKRAKSKRPAAAPVKTPQATLHLEFDDNARLPALFGAHHTHLTLIERALGVVVHTRGNRVAIVGDGAAAEAASAVLKGLYARLVKGLAVDEHEVEAALRLAVGGERARAEMMSADLPIIRTKKRHVSPRTATQKSYLDAIDSHDLVFGIGPAGTGKTYLAVAKAVERLLGGHVDRIILSRPAVEAGEQLGFLPGDMREKVDPYLRPLYDALHDMMPAEQVAKRLESGEIEVAPIAFMRGRTLANAFVIVDEAQNTTAVQMKMLLTRLGENASMIVTGDLSQVDLPRGTRSGLRDAMEILAGVEGVSFVRFSEEDVVRHRLVARIVHAYDEADRRRKTGARYERANGNANPGRADADD